MGIMAKNCCSIDRKAIVKLRVTHTSVETIQQWSCCPDENALLFLYLHQWSLKKSNRFWPIRPSRALPLETLRVDSVRDLDHHYLKLTTPVSTKSVPTVAGADRWLLEDST